VPPAAEVWRLLTTWRGEPGFQMALDEALLQSRVDRPTLRFYTWEPAALSLGYFQRFEDVPRVAGAPVVVRRLTGGGAIYHAQELTFSIATPAHHPLYAGPIAASYARVHAWIAATLADLGVQADLRGERALASDRDGTGMCFHRSTNLDLAWDGAKGVGSAQRRTGGRVLHHGSIKLDATPLEAGVAGLRDREPALTPEGLAQRLVARLSRALAVETEPAEPEQHELRQAFARAAFFRSPEFVRRR